MKDDDTVIGTPEMVEEAREILLAMIREGRWPEPYDGPDQVFDPDDLPPAERHPLKAAE